ncbi:MAG: ABC transporter permease [Chloroflexota bacterium]|nr:ABC transporter permease [Chloroflexota bacterium]
MANVALTQPDSRVIVLEPKKQKAESLLRLTFNRFIRHRAAVLGTALLTFIILYVTVGTLFVTEAAGNRTNIMDKYAAPSIEHPFGTDEVGRDVFARTIYGGQISLMIAIAAMIIATTLGTLVGLVSAYFGGIIDAILMRFVEALLAIPALVLLLLLSRQLAGNTTEIMVLGRQLSATVIIIVVIIGLTSWMRLSRIIRAQVLTLKEQEFVQAARLLGASDARIIFGHILPNCIAPIVVAATLEVGSAIITEAYLSFLGFGVMPPTATWGNILTRSRDVLDQYPWMWMAPGALIVITTLAINFIGDGLRDALDPRMKNV